MKTLNAHEGRKRDKVASLCTFLQTKICFLDERRRKREETAEQQDHDRISDARNAKNISQSWMCLIVKTKPIFLFFFLLTWQKLPSDIAKFFLLCTSKTCEKALHTHTHTQNNRLDPQQKNNKRRKWIKKILFYCFYFLFRKKMHFHVFTGFPTANFDNRAWKLFY